jgi:hypothetical protein
MVIIPKSEGEEQSSSTHMPRMPQMCGIVVVPEFKKI